MAGNRTGDVRRAAAQQLETWRDAGVTHVGKRRGGKVQQRTVDLATEKAPGQAKTPGGSSVTMTVRTETKAGLFVSGKIAGAALPLAEKIAALELVKKEVVACTRCSHLACSRTQTVFGVGSAQARLCFVGEAPGADEDAQGVPFVGRAGQLLTKIIEACTLKRDEVYILNVLKCRPPDNRTPLPDEVANCRGYLDRQLEIIRPEYVCCLGAVAAQTLLNTTQSIGRLRGKFQAYRGIPVLCTYHPSYLLRNPAAKRDVWEDMKMLMARMGVELK